MNYWVTADWHYNHRNILKYCGRTEFMTKFDLDKYNFLLNASEEEQKKLIISKESLTNMNEALVKNHNERVKDEDIVLYLGDCCFKNSKGGKPGEGEQEKALDIIKRFKGRFVFIAGNHDCFSQKTRLLTIEGYKFYNEIKVGDLIPTYNLEEKIVEYKPIKKIIINYVDKAYCFKNRYNEGEFSYNHKFLRFGFNKRRNEIVEKITTKDIWNFKSGVIIPTSVESKLIDFNIKDYELALLGLILTDGYFYKTKKNIWKIFIYQSKLEGIKKIEEVLQGLNIKYEKKEGKKRDKPTIIEGKAVKSSLTSYTFCLDIDFCTSFMNKHKIEHKFKLPEFLWNCSDRQINILVDYMIVGNGNIKKLLEINTNVIWGKKELLLNYLGLFVTHGIDSTLVETKSKDYYLCIHKYRGGYGKFSVQAKDRKIIPYNDDMWCVEVDNHVIFTELNGKPLISCNSSNALKTPIISCKIRYANKIINCVHNPEFVDMDCNINFVGHVHQHWKFKRIVRGGKITDVVNCGVDVWNFRPIKIEEALVKLNRWQKENNYI